METRRYPKKGVPVCGTSSTNAVTIIGLLNTIFSLAVIIYHMLLLREPSGFTRHDLLIFIPGAEDLHSLIVGVLLTCLVIIVCSILLVAGAILRKIDLILPWMCAVPLIIFFYIGGMLISMAVYSEVESLNFIAAQAASAFLVFIMLFVQLFVIAAYWKEIQN